MDPTRASIPSYKKKGKELPWGLLDWMPCLNIIYFIFTIIK